jgi:hypothetical protein
VHDEEPYDVVGWITNWRFSTPGVTKLVADLVSIGRRNGNIFDLKDKEFAGAACTA